MVLKFCSISVLANETKPAVTSLPRIWFKHSLCWKWNKYLMQHTLLRWSVTQLGLWPKDLTWAAATHSSKGTGLWTVPRLPFSTREPQEAQPGEVLCPSGACWRGAHSMGGWPGHWDTPPGCFTYCISTERQYVVCCMCYSLLLIPHSESLYKGKKITLRNWEPCMEHSPTERGPIKKSVRHLLANFKPEPKTEMEKKQQQLEFLSSNLLAYNSQQRDLAVIKRVARYPSEIWWFYDSFQVAEYEIPAPFSPGAIHLPQVMEKPISQQVGCSHRP